MKLATPYGVLISLMMIGQSNSAFGFEYLYTGGGKVLAWSTSEVSFYVDSEWDEVNARQIRAAYDSWNTVIEPSLPVKYGGQHSSDAADSVSTTHLLSTWNSDYGDSDLTVAHTRLVYEVSTGTITEADILLNGERFNFGPGAGEFDTQSVVLHELGHGLGFGHSCGEPGGRYPSCFTVSEPSILNAVMAPTLSVGGVRRAFTNDDLAGLQDKYGAIRSDAPPEIRNVSYDCLNESLLIELKQPLETPTVTLRTMQAGVNEVDLISNEGTRLVILPRTLESRQTVDIIVRDEQTGAYGAYYGFQLPPPSDCQTQTTTLSSPGDGDTDQEASCGCNSLTTTSKGRMSLFLGCLFLFGLLASSIARKRFLAGLLLLCAIPTAADAYRCTRTQLNLGPSLIWTEREITWVLSDVLTDDFPDQSEVVDTVIAAFDVWSEPNCSDLKLSYQGQASGLSAQFNDDGQNQNAVVFVKTGWLHQPGVVALTSNAFDRGSGVILDTDIEINDQFFGWANTDAMCTTDMDLKNALVHEIGHFIGLAHPPSSEEYEDATMFALAKPCETKKSSLAQDDIDGLCAIYPTGEAAKQCHPPDGPGFLQTEKDLGYGCQALSTETTFFWFYAALFGLYWRKKSSKVDDFCPVSKR